MPEFVFFISISFVPFKYVSSLCFCNFPSFNLFCPVLSGFGLFRFVLSCFNMFSMPCFSFYMNEHQFYIAGGERLSRPEVKQVGQCLHRYLISLRRYCIHIFDFETQYFDEDHNNTYSLYYIKTNSF